MRILVSLLIASFVLVAMCPVSAALASDEVIILTFDDYTPAFGTHEDAAPFKGWLDVTVTNNMAEPWGDFHFEITEVMSYDMSTVDFIVDPPFEPTSSQSPLSWVVDNAAYGATLDLFYYDDPVLPGETATFSVYTDNTTAQVPFFGWCIYPTPVPEPATLFIIMAAGLPALLKRRRSRR